MPYTTRIRKRAHVIALSGRFLGIYERSSWSGLISDVCASGRPRVVIDCSAVTFMDSVGVGLLADAAHRIRAAQGDVCLAGLHGPTGEVLRTLSLAGGAIETFASTEEALREWRAPTRVVAL